MSIPMSEIGWVAGFLEGEAYFALYRGKYPVISVTQVDICPIDRLHSLFGGTMRKRAGNGPNRQPYWRWDASTLISIQILMTIWSLVGTKRREEIERVIEVWKDNRTYKRKERRTVA